MTLLSLSIALQDTNKQLARIADALEFAAGMRPVVAKPVKQAGLEDISRISNMTTWEQEREREAERLNPMRRERAEPEL